MIYVLINDLEFGDFITKKVMLTKHKNDSVTQVDSQTLQLMCSKGKLQKLFPGLLFHNTFCVF